MAGADVVEARVDDAVVDEAHRLTHEEPLDAAHGVGAHVRREAVAQRVGQPVDEGDVAEDVATTEVGAVRLEGVQAVGCEGHDGAARPGHAHHLGGRGAVVIDVLDDLVAEDEVEVVIGVGQVLADRQHDVGQFLAGLGHPLLLDLDAVDVIAVLAEAAHVGADAAAHVEHTRVLEVDVLAHHLEAAVLAVAPRVAGPAALDGRGRRLLGLVGPGRVWQVGCWARGRHRAQRYGTCATSAHGRASRR